jgi:copper homeostasis protein
MTLLEICVDDLAGAVIAEQCGADRIELCTNLHQGGTTPDLGTVSSVLAALTGVGLQVLVRSRPGDFVYGGAEVDAMLADIAAIRALPPPPGITVGFVIGALTRDGRVDVPALTRLRRACGPAPVTFHKAFDEAADLKEALEVLMDLGIDRVLTSGGRPTALDGADRLADLVQQANDRIAILAGGGIRAHNVAEIVRRTGVREVHLRATRSTGPAGTSSPVGARGPAATSSTSAEVVRAVVAACSP